MHIGYGCFEGLMQYCSNPSALAMELLQYSTKPSICGLRLSEYVLFNHQGLVTNILINKLIIKSSLVKSSSPGQNGRHSEDDICTCIFENERFCILITISLEFILKCPIDNHPAPIQYLAPKWWPFCSGLLWFSTTTYFLSSVTSRHSSLYLITNGRTHTRKDQFLSFGKAATRKRLM